MEMCLVGSAMIQAEGRTHRRADMTKLISVFRDYKNVPTNGRHVAKDEVKIYTVTWERKQLYLGMWRYAAS